MTQYLPGIGHVHANVTEAHTTIDSLLDRYMEAGFEQVPVVPGLPAHLSMHEQRGSGYVAAFYPDMDSMFSAWGPTRSEALCALADNVSEAVMERRL